MSEDVRDGGVREQSGELALLLVVRVGGGRAAHEGEAQPLLAPGSR